MNASRIVERQLGATVGERTTRVQAAYGVPSLLMVVVSDAACVARLKGWSTVSVAINADGRLGMTFEKEAS